MQEYSNGGYEDNEPDYVLEGLQFIGTCGSFPEQYDVVYPSSDGKRYQVGYVRLRGGLLLAECFDVGGDVIFLHRFVGHNQGSFETEEDRVQYLTLIAKKIKQYLEGISYGYA